MRAVCASVPGPGHAYPMLSVAEALVKRGHEVVFVSGTEHVSHAASVGAAFERMPFDKPGDPHPLHTPYEDAAWMAEEMAPTIARLRPDVVVHDVLTLGPALAAEAAGIPYATLVIHALHTPSRDLPPFGWGYQARPGRFGRRKLAQMQRGKLADLARARDDLNRARARLGLPPTERIDGQLSPDLVLVATLPSLELPRSDWPDSAHVVGPCLWHPPEHPVDLPPGADPLVLVAGSTAHDQGALLRGAIEAVRRLGWRAVVTAGRTDVPAALPPGVVASEFASHGPVLEHAAAVVCNGGHGITARALSAGVPVVIVPAGGDQRENGYRVERIGAGVRLWKPKPRALAHAIRRCATDEPTRAAAARVAAEAAGIYGPARSAELVESLRKPVTS